MKLLARLVNRSLGRFVREEHGQSLMEFVLLTGVISLAAIAALGTMSDGLATMYENAGVRLEARSVSELISR